MGGFNNFSVKKGKYSTHINFYYVQDYHAGICGGG